MARHRFEPILGQRYVRNRPALPPDVCFICEVIVPNTLIETERFVLSVELATERLTYTRPELASHILSGYLKPPDETILPVYRGLSLSELLVNSTEEQRRRFKMRVTYVFALERADVGQSWKSPDFCDLVQATYHGRQESYLAEIASGAKDVPPIEPKPPSPHSAYRWLRAYRSSACDLRALASELIVIRKRQPRRGREQRLLDAFLAHKKAFTGNSTIAQLTLDFNEHISRLDPRHLDREIERLHEEAVRVAAANATLRKKKGVNRPSKKRPLYAGDDRHDTAATDDDGDGPV